MPHLRPKKDPYQVLGIQPGADPDEIRSAYRKMALQFHPDVNAGPEAEARMKEINLAYDSLKDVKPVESIEDMLARMRRQAGFMTREAREERMRASERRDREAKAKSRDWRPYDRPYTPPKSEKVWVDGTAYESAYQAATLLKVEIHGGESVIAALRRAGHFVPGV